MQDFKGKTVAVTGGATGIGFALAQALGKEGAKIVIGEPRQEKLEEATELLTEHGIAVAATQLDVTDPMSVEAFAEFGWSVADRVDVLINNAGISLPPGRMMNVTVEDARALFDVNFFGVWHGASVFGTRMMKDKRPSAIFNVASENAFFNAAPGMAAYIASKHAVRGLTEAMREDFPEHIQIGMIIPGLVASDMTGEHFADTAMPANEFAGTIVEQMKAGEFYMVSHACNMERIKPIHDEIEGAYAKYAPRYEGDMALDVRALIEKMRSN